MRQQPRLTVGDTTTIVHRVRVPAGALVQPRGLADTTLATLLGPVNVTREGDSVRIAYTVTIWAPGQNSLVLPGAVVARLDGRIDTLPDARVVLNVASVLPTGTPASQVPAKQARPWVARADRTWLPWGVAGAIVALVALAVWWQWRRRGPAPPPRARATIPPLDAARIAAWIAAGEAHLAVMHLDAALHGVARASAWHERVEALRFAPTEGHDLDALAREGLALFEESAS